MEDGFIVDTTELKVIFIDNGDDKVHLQIQSKGGHSTSTICNKFIPAF